MSFSESLETLIAENRNGLLSIHPSWSRVALLNVCSIQNGYPFESLFFSHSDGMPLIRIRNVLQGATETFFNSGYDDSFVVHNDDLLVGMDGDFHCALWSGGPALLNQRVCRLIPDQQLYLKRFLRYCLPGYLQAINSATSSITVKHLSSRTIADIPLPFPPLKEQRRIVAKIEELFSDLDAGVAALKRAKANLKRYRASVLKAAVEGKLTADWRAKHPQVEPASQLLAHILTERRDKWAADQLAKFAAAHKPPPKNWRDKYVEPLPPDTTDPPALPDGWCWASVEQLGCVQLGRQRSPKNRSDRFPTKYIRAANITEAGLALDDILDMEFQPRELETYRLHVGDILLSEASGSPDQVGKPAVWNGEIQNCCFQNTVIRLRPHGMLGEYALTVFRYYYVNKVFAKVAAGVGINHLSAAKFSRLAFPLAPLHEQSEVVADVAETFSQIDAAQHFVDHALLRAARLRQSILKQAFSGKLVPQDPRDEPASKLLERLHASQPASTPTAKPPKKTAKTRPTHNVKKKQKASPPAGDAFARRSDV
jgi:type I restriction enzyme S subunit